MRAFFAGLRRGAKLGALTMLIIMVPLGMLGLTVELNQPHARDHAFGTPGTLVTDLGGFCVGLGLAAIYGAITGGLIVGLATLFQGRAQDK